MKRYTISEIAAANEAAGNYYFSKDTLQFFKQKRGDFKVKHIAGRVFVFAPSRWDGKLMGYSVGEFHPETGEVNKPREHMNTFYNLTQVENYFDSLKQTA